jgi:hypothetical protein
MFQEALQFHFVIVLYYNKHIAMRVNDQVPPPRIWQISQIIVDCLSPIISACIFN